MTSREARIRSWMDECAIDRETAWAMLVEEANGYRGMHPDELGHLTAHEARALDRRESGLPAETAGETALYSSILDDAGVDPGAGVVTAVG